VNELKEFHDLDFALETTVKLTAQLATPDVVKSSARSSLPRRTPEA